VRGPCQLGSWPKQEWPDAGTAVSLTLRRGCAKGCEGAYAAVLRRRERQAALRIVTSGGLWIASSADVAGAPQRFCELQDSGQSCQPCSRDERMGNGFAAGSGGAEWCRGSQLSRETPVCRPAWPSHRSCSPVLTRRFASGLCFRHQGVLQIAKLDEKRSKLREVKKAFGGGGVRSSDPTRSAARHQMAGSTLGDPFPLCRRRHCASGALLVAQLVTRNCSKAEHWLRGKWQRLLPSSVVLARRPDAFPGPAPTEEHCSSS
jgi:hypothetical protein